jgi:predicted SAM-dependent methyltransferase
MTKQVKIDIGCGTHDEWIEGDWIRVDPYVKEADVHCVAWDLPYLDNTVDEIWSSHLLEHLYKKQVAPTLKEWYRVLKTGGKLTVRVPDLEWCCNWWLSHQTMGWDLDIIYGGQSREGEAHHTGFNEKIMKDYLHEAKFRIIKMEELRTHGQKTLSFECIK